MIMKAPPKELIFVIPLIPRELNQVTTITKIIAKIPINCVESKAPICQLCVVSRPKSNADNVIQSREALETIHRTQLASQINVPMNASFSPIELLTTVLKCRKSPI